MKMMAGVNALNEALKEEMARDENVMIIGEDVGVYGGGCGVTKGLINLFGEQRVVETPISETAFTGMAVGAAIMGLRPVVEIMFADFTSLTIDPIVNHAAKLPFMSGGKITVPMVLRAPICYGTGAAAQHSQSVESLFLNTPGLKVVAPSCSADLKGLLKSAIRDDASVIFLEHKLLYKCEMPIPEGEYTIPIGKADIKCEGSDVTIISYSNMVNTCIQASEKLKNENISAEVIDLRTLKPLDTEAILSSAMKTKRVIIAHAAPAFGGFGAQILSEIIENSTIASQNIKIKRVCGCEMPIAYSKQLESNSVANADDIIKAVKEIL